jgi:hypothetical protein
MPSKIVSALILSDLRGIIKGQIAGGLRFIDAQPNSLTTAPIERNQFSQRLDHTNVRIWPSNYQRYTLRGMAKPNGLSRVSTRAKPIYH